MPEQDNWDLMLPVLDFAINVSYQESFEDTPFFAKYGKHPHLPDDIRRQGKPSKTPRAYDFISNIEKTVQKAETCLKVAQHCQNKHCDARAGCIGWWTGHSSW